MPDSVKAYLEEKDDQICVGKWAFEHDLRGYAVGDPKKFTLTRKLNRVKKRIEVQRPHAYPPPQMLLHIRVHDVGGAYFEAEDGEGSGARLTAQEIARKSILLRDDSFRIPPPVRRG